MPKSHLWISEHGSDSKPYGYKALGQAWMEGRSSWTPPGRRIKKENKAPVGHV